MVLNLKGKSQPGIKNHFSNRFLYSNFMVVFTRKDRDMSRERAQFPTQFSGLQLDLEKYELHLSNEKNLAWLGL